MSRQQMRAIFENGVFRPLDQPASSFKDGQQVDLVVSDDAPKTGDSALQLATAVYRGLSPAQIDDVEQIALKRTSWFHDEGHDQ